MAITFAHPEDVFQFVADYYAVPFDALVSDHRCPPLPSFRRVAASAAYRLTEFSQQDVAEALGHDRTWFSYVRSLNEFEAGMVDRVVAAWNKTQEVPGD